MNDKEKAYCVFGVLQLVQILLLYMKADNKNNSKA